jgi:undecaprenyl-diphosphatase
MNDTGLKDNLRRLSERFPSSAVLAHGAAVGGRIFELARREIMGLAALFIVAGGLWSFVELAEDVREGETLSFDRAILLALRDPSDLSNPIGPPGLDSVARDVTALGGHFVLTFVTLAVICYLLLERKRGAALLVFVSVAGGTLVGSLLKLGFGRPRPELVPHSVEVFTASFPSNHAMLSAVTYLTLGVLLARLTADFRVKAYFLGLAVLLTVLVGASRVYLGVHWPTDVLAGWAIGAAWAMAMWLIALVLQRRGNVAPPE